MRKPDLILGMVWDLSATELEPFVGSAQQVGCVQNILLFTDGLKEEDEVMLTNWGVRMLKLEKSFDRGMVSGNRLRYFYYQEYLHLNVEKYRYVMLTDVRDVVFQLHPFSFNTEDGLNVFLEHNKLIGECDWNRGWVRVIYGQEGLDKVKDRPISCSGVTIGPAPEVLDYLNLMCEEFAKTTVALGGIDQGVHNYLLWTNRLDNILDRVNFNLEGPVMTMGYMPGEIFKFDSRNRLTNLNSKPAHIVHQHDRYGSLWEADRFKAQNF